MGRAVGHYRIFSKIGAGGWGEALRSVATWLGRKATIKLLPVNLSTSTERRQRFVKEVKAALASTIRTLVRSRDDGTADAFPFIAMQLVSTS